MPHCSSRASGCFALPQELGRSLESRAGRYPVKPSDRLPISVTGKIIAHAAARAHVRNGLTIDPIRTRHQLLFLGPTLLPTLRQGFTAVLFHMRGAVQFAWRRGKTASARNPRNIFAENTR